MRTTLVLLAALLAGCAAPPPPPPPAPQPARPDTDRPPRPPQQSPREPVVTVVERPAAAPAPVAMGVARRLEMRATGYCLRGSMRTGVRTRDGMMATDPSVIPLGSVARVSLPDGRLVGLFVAMDTGGAIRGNKIDLYMESCREALDWGIQRVVVEVIQIGWAR